MANKPFSGAKESGMHPKRNAFDFTKRNNLTVGFFRNYPIMCEEILPGETIRFKPSVGFKLAPLTFPTHSPIKLHMEFYYVKNRTLWKNWTKFIHNQGHHDFPWIAINEGSPRAEHFGTRSMFDYFNIPTTIVKNTNFRARVKMSSAAQGDALRPRSFDPHAPLERRVVTTANRTFEGTGLDNTPIVLTATASSLGLHVDGLIAGSNVFADKIIEQYAGQQCIGVPLTNFTTLASTSYNVKMLYSDLITADIQASQALTFDNAHIYDIDHIANEDCCVAYLDEDFRLLFAYDSTLKFNDGQPRLSVNTDRFNDTLAKANGKMRIAIMQQIDPNGRYISDPTVLATDPNYACLGTYMTYKATATMPLDLRDHPAENPFIIHSGDNEPAIKLNALPFRAYEMIKNTFKRNIQVDPFYKNGQVCYDEFITNDGDGADSTTPISFFNTLYEKDCYTSCLPKTFSGTQSLAGLTTVTVNDGQQYLVHTNDDGTKAILKDAVDENGKPYIAVDGEIDQARKDVLSYMANTSYYGISTNDLRNASCLQTWLQKNYVRGMLYPYQLEAHWGVSPSFEILGLPEYLVGFNSLVQIDQVTNTSVSQDGVLGEFAGFGSVGDTGREISCYANEHGYVIGLLSMTTTPVYTQNLNRLWSRRLFTEFYTPELGNLGYQPVKYDQICPVQAYNDSRVDLRDDFGYQLPFAELFQCEDEAHGEFRTDLSDMLVQRHFSTTPTLSADFIYGDADDANTIFSITDDNKDKAYGQVSFAGEKIMPVKKFNGGSRIDHDGSAS